MTQIDPAASHPTDVLIAEHDVILTVLDALQTEAESLDGAGPINAEFWNGAIDFIRTFADGCHHAKEEDLLFPAMVAAGIPHHDGPIGCLLGEHVEGRDLVGRIAYALRAGDRQELANAARGYVALLTQHIDKENEVLFQLARQVLSPDATRKLTEQFSGAVAERFGAGTHEKYVALAAQLCTHAQRS